jgi:glycosyltransferase involved in cell wall biosynthesis
MDPLMGGVSQAVETMIRSLNKLNVHNEVASLDSPGLLDTSSEIIRHELGPARRFWAYNKKLTIWLNENIARFDVVIVHGLWLHYGYAVRKSIERYGNKNLKVFVMPHGMLDPYFQKATGRKLKAIRNTLYWHLIEKHLINTADGIFFTCQTELDLARTTFNGYLPKKELVVGLGVDSPPVYSPAMKTALYSTCPGLMNKKYLLFLSRIHEKKGVDLVITAFEKFYSKQADEAPSTVPMLVLAGPGLDTEYGAGMKLKAEQSKLSGNIIFPGMLTGDAKWGAFYHCEAFVLPSHQENFGIAIIEALACGKPVLISNQVNIWHEIEKEQVGIVADDNEAGVLLMLKYYKLLSVGDKTDLKLLAMDAFERNFSTSQAAKRIVQAIGIQHKQKTITPVQKPISTGSDNY